MELHLTAPCAGKLLRFLRRELGLSSSLVKRLKWQGAFTINGQAAKTSDPVLPGDQIAVRLEEAPPDFPAEDMALSILYEDEALLVVDKPQGILTHPSFHRLTGTLANGIQGYYQRTGQACAVHLVSRLDRDTFGVVVTAKNAHIHALLMEAQGRKAVEKTYEALVWGQPPAETGRWTWPIGRCPGESLLRQIDPQGQEAVTDYQVAEQGDGLSRLVLTPRTGRTHQLRLHCAQSGCPILGDLQYGTPASQAYSQKAGIQGQQLLARQIQFVHPITGQAFVFSSRQALRPLDQLLQSFHHPGQLLL